SRVRVESGGREFFVFLHVARSRSPNRNAERCNRCTDAERKPCRPRQPEISHSEYEPQRHADALRNAAPVHGCAPASSSRAGAITCSAEIFINPASVSRLRLWDVMLLGSRRTMLRVPYGPVRAGSVGPKSATTGIFKAAARCMGPVSPPMKSA